MLINLKLKRDACVEFVSACLDFIKTHCHVDFNKQGHLILLSSLRIKQPLPTDGLRSMHCQDTDLFSLSGPHVVKLHQSKAKNHTCTVLPSDFRIPDALLATWIHFATVLEIQTTCITVPGRSTSLLSNNDLFSFRFSSKLPF